ncbi:MAG: hypothetical protein AAF108_12130 [Planctomycetota bacterium]
MHTHTAAPIADPLTGSLRSLIVVVLALGLTAADTFAQGSFRGRRSRTVTRTVTIEEVIEEYEEATGWLPVPVVYIRNRDSRNPWINDQVPALSRAFEDAVLEVGLDTKNAYDVLEGDPIDTATALTVVQLLDGDCMVDLSINSFQARQLRAPGDAAWQYTLRMTGKVIDPVTGTARGRIDIPDQKYTARSPEPESEYYFEELFNEAMKTVVPGLAEPLETIVKKLEEVEEQPSPKVGIYPVVQDMTFPVFRENNGSVFPTGELASATPTVTVSIGGVVIGSGPGTFDLSKYGRGITPGIRVVEVSAPQFEPFRRKVFITDGQVIDIPLVMTAAAKAEWKDTLVLMTDLANETKLTDAQAELLRGKAQQFANSKYSIDIKKDINSDVNVDIESAYDIRDNLQQQLDGGNLLDATAFSEVREAQIDAIQEKVKLPADADEAGDLSPAQIQAAASIIPMNA